MFTSDLISFDSFYSWQFLVPNKKHQQKNTVSKPHTHVRWCACATITYSLVFSLFILYTVHTLCTYLGWLTVARQRQIFFLRGLNKFSVIQLEKNLENTPLFICSAGKCHNCIHFVDMYMVLLCK